MKTKHLRLMQRVYIILFFCFMYLPIAYMIVFSFNQSKGYSLFTGFTLKWYRSLFTNASILHALWVSVEVAVLSAIIATVLGTAASLGIASMSRKSRLLVTNITYIPVVNPEIITGISLMLLFVAYQRFAAQSAWLPERTAAAWLAKLRESAMSSAWAAAFGGCTSLVIVDLSAVPASLPLIPALAIRPIAKEVSSILYFTAPAIGATYLNVSPISPTLVLDLEVAAASTSAK